MYDNFAHIASQTAKMLQLGHHVITYGNIRKLYLLIFIAGLYSYYFIEIFRVA